MNVRWLVAAIVAGVAGWFAGRSPTPMSTAVVFGTTTSAGGHVSVLPAGTRVAADCDARVAQRLEDLDEMRRDAYGEAVPFPPDLDPVFLPAAIEERARRVEFYCPELGWKLIEVECSEYPCFTVWDTPPVPDPANLDTFLTDFKAWLSLQSKAMKCGAAVEVPGSGTSYAGRGEHIIAPLQPGVPFEGFDAPTDGRRKTRLAYRADLVVAGLRDTFADTPPARP